MAKELAKAYVQIIPTTKNIKNNLKAALEGGGAADAAGKSVGSKIGSSILGGIGSVAAGAGKIIGTGILAGAGAIGVLGKQAISAYADFEQLAGGVETLFGTNGLSITEYAQSVGRTIGEVRDEYAQLDKAQNDVMNNASNAFKTAGMSSNEYMETVTSFSAALISSLDGDTVKAAAVADQAIVDMSDNANKMGTSMESIQNAYQGFAKQNYTMLDNLKLGYGGTKQEMERLLEDAGKISGTKYDISSLNDVYEAIHVVQTEFGITGTTAKEAESTISGSLGMLKASWQNMLTGIADENADFDKLIGDVVESAGAFAKNIMPRIETTLEGFGTFAEKLAPIITNALPDLIEVIIPSLLSSAVVLVKTLANAIIENLPLLLNTAGNMIGELANGLISALPSLVPAGVDIALKIVDTLVDNIDMLVDVAIDLIMALTEGLIAALPIIIEKAPEIIEKLSQAFITTLPKLVTLGGDLLYAIAEGLVENVPKLLNKIPQIINSLIQAYLAYQNTIKQIGMNVIKFIADGIQSKISDIKAKVGDIVDGIKNTFLDAVGAMTSVGLNLVQGIWQGISNGYTWITSKISGWVKDVLSFIKKAFGIASPSKLMRDEVGKYLAQGVWEGFNQENPFGQIEANVKTKFESISGNTLDMAAKSGMNTIDYDRLGNAVANSLEKAGLTIKVDNRELGRVVRQYA